MLKSPTSSKRSAGSYSVRNHARSASYHRSFVAYSALPTVRPFTAYRHTIRTPPMVAPMTRVLIERIARKSPRDILPADC